MIKFVMLLAITLVMSITQLNAAPKGHENDQTSANAMYIKYASVDWDYGLLLISGYGIPANAQLLTVMLGDDKLAIIDIDTNGVIAAALPEHLMSIDGFQGDALLVVTSRKKPVRTASFMLTIGAVGPQGEVGEKGATGDTGPTGPQGIAGPQGIQGFQGEHGLQGIQGAKGEQGLRGIQGPQGEQGPIGPEGGTAIISDLERNQCALAGMLAYPHVTTFLLSYFSNDPDSDEPIDFAEQTFDFTEDPDTGYVTELKLKKEARKRFNLPASCFVY